MTADVHPSMTSAELIASCADALPGEGGCTATGVGSIAPAVRHTPRQAGLMLWKDVLLENVQSRQPDLTNRQMAVLLVVYTSKHAQTVGSLVAALALPEPTVSRSVIALEALGYLKRCRHPTDARRTLMTSTALGAAFLAHLESTIAKANNHRVAVGPQDTVEAVVS
jgi:DNA-binding MarR family transcriptional regulator